MPNEISDHRSPSLFTLTILLTYASFILHGVIRFRLTPAGNRSTSDLRTADLTRSKSRLPRDRLMLKMRSRSLYGCVSVVSTCDAAPPFSRMLFTWNDASSAAAVSSTTAAADDDDGLHADLIGGGDERWSSAAGNATSSSSGSAWARSLSRTIATRSRSRTSSVGKLPRPWMLTVSSITSFSRATCS